MKLAASLAMACLLLTPIALAEGNGPSANSAPDGQSQTDIRTCRGDVDAACYGYEDVCHVVRDPETGLEWEECHSELHLCIVWAADSFVRGAPCYTAEDILYFVTPVLESPPSVA